MSEDEKLDLECVLRAWSASNGAVECNAPAKQLDIEAAERSLGRGLPDIMRQFYRRTDGADVCEGNLWLYPLASDGGVSSVSDCTRRLREWEWTIPEEVILFGSDGSESSFGIWCPVDQELTRYPVVEIAATDGLAMVGSSLTRFLIGRTICLLLMCADRFDVDEALRILGVPGEIIATERYDPDWANVVGWADPTLPDPDPDPYGELSREAIMAIAMLDGHAGPH